MADWDDLADDLADDTTKQAFAILDIIQANCQSDAVNVLAKVLNAENIKAADIKRTREELRPALAKWAKVAVEFGLPSSIVRLRLKPYVAPTCWLPPSFHEANFEAAWQFQEIYQEMLDQDRTGVRLRMLDPYLEPIIALFHGCIIDTPGEERYANDYTIFGEVEHDLVLFGDTLFIVVELTDRVTEAYNNCVAHLLLEFLSTTDIEQYVLQESLRVYGLMTDLMTFHFYSYDLKNKQFNVDEKFVVDHSRERFCYDMISVTNKIFSILLNGYVEALGYWVPIKISKCTASQNDSEADKIVRPKARKRPDRFSTPIENWTQALSLAQQSHAKFQLPFSDLDSLEGNATEGIRLLTESVQLLPRESSFSGESDPFTAEELNAMAKQSVRNWHETLLTRLS
ncbi:hypothetical protein BD410DRAFT_844310 [Rickenella mellea]|uniref:Uncharacterized protein n=1 Tax=Rickenella mellea TaxID=50990 RepID=A0A4Y7PNZ4_9AGAM|nr:hypothetical protein BD410DRAFT_844310 [Rickenella mellea]